MKNNDFDVAFVTALLVLGIIFTGVLLMAYDCLTKGC